MDRKPVGSKGDNNSVTDQALGLYDLISPGSFFPIYALSQKSINKHKNVEAESAWSIGGLLMPFFKGSFGNYPLW